MKDPGDPTPETVAALAARPAPWAPVQWWRIHGEHCDVRFAVDRDGLLCAGDDAVRDWAKSNNDRRPHAFATAMKQRGPVQIERVEGEPSERN